MKAEGEDAKTKKEEKEAEVPEWVHIPYTPPHVKGSRGASMESLYDQSPYGIAL